MDHTPPVPEAGMRDVSVPMLRAAAICQVLALLVMGGALGIHYLVWQAFSGSDVLGWAIGPLLAAFAVSIVVHEALHLLGFALFGRAPLRSLKIGISWAAMMPFAHCSVPLECTAYRAACALPGVALGVLPWAAGVAVGSGGLSVYGAVMLGAAMGDALVIWVIRGVPAGQFVLDHPSAVGCHVIVGDPAARVL